MSSLILFAKLFTININIYILYNIIFIYFNI
jgi:hypothetical protein